ncbi:alpha/beta fold hydrolase [Phenylobacterium sp.]|uniref:alpha/beta fold hydrolase n=1 Tax=Phenylobacterium sp. TaxID=1871053 RepID=UPI0037CAC66A
MKASGNAQDAPGSAHEPRMEIMKIAGRSLRVAVWKARSTKGNAKGRPILFFNGIGANIEIMASLAEWMPDQDIITFDMPGIGGSPSPRFPYRPWTMALRTTRLLDKLGYTGKVDVMGVSWGGGMAQQFAFQHPDRIGKLILAATAAGVFMAPGDPKVLAKMANPRRYIDPEFMRQNFEALYGEEMNSDAHIGRLRPPSQRGYLYQLAAMAGWTSAFFLPFLKTPTLILMGESDRIVPLVNGRFLARLIPNAQLETVPGGHLFMVSRPAETFPVIRRFLAGADQQPLAAAA